MPLYDPQYTIVLIIGIPKRVPQILGNTQISQELQRAFRPPLSEAPCLVMIPANISLGFKVLGLGFTRFRSSPVTSWNSIPFHKARLSPETLSPYDLTEFCKHKIRECSGAENCSLCTAPKICQDRGFGFREKDL